MNDEFGGIPVEDEFGGVAVDGGNSALQGSRDLADALSAVRQTPTEYSRFGGTSTTSGNRPQEIPTVNSQDVSDAIKTVYTDLSKPAVDFQFQRNQNDSGVTQAAKGVGNVAIGLPEFFTSPLGATTGAVGSVGGIASKIIGGLFALDMASNVPKQLKDAKEATEKFVAGDPNVTLQDVVQHTAGIALSPVLLGKLSEHVAGLEPAAAHETGKLTPYKPLENPFAPKAMPVSTDTKDAQNAQWDEQEANAKEFEQTPLTPAPNTVAVEPEQIAPVAQTPTAPSTLPNDLADLNAAIAEIRSRTIANTIVDRLQTKPAEVPNVNPEPQAVEVGRSQPARPTEEVASGIASDIQQAPPAVEPAQAPTPKPTPQALAQPATDLGTGRYRLGRSPQTYRLLERLKQSQTEINLGEQPVRVVNEKTGRPEVALESDLTPVAEAPTVTTVVAPKPNLADQLTKAGYDVSDMTVKQQRDLAKRPEVKAKIKALPTAPVAQREIGRVSDYLKSTHGLTDASKVEVIHDASPKAAEGYAELRDGQLMKIVLNSAKLPDAAAIDRVLGHELGHAAVESGRVREILSTVTPDELDGIKAGIKRLGYDPSIADKEADARKVDALVKSWGARNWFEQAVGHVLELANRIGLPVTRLGAERAAVRAIGQELTRVRTEGMPTQKLESKAEPKDEAVYHGRQPGLPAEGEHPAIPDVELYNLKKPIVDEAGRVLHPEGSTVAKSTLEKYGVPHSEPPVRLESKPEPPTERDEGSPGEDTEWRRLQVAGKQMVIPEANALPRAQMEPAYDAAVKIMQDLKFPGATDRGQKLGPGTTDPNFYFKIDPSQAFEPDAYDAEARKLIDLFTKEAAKVGTVNENLPFLAALSHIISYNYNEGRWNGVVSEPLIRRMISLAASHRSQLGASLRMLRGAPQPDDLRKLSQNTQIELQRVFAEAIDPEGKIAPMIERLVTHFRDFFSPQEISDALKGHPDLETWVNKLVLAKSQEQGGRLFRRIQNELKPKKSLTPEQKEVNAILEEAARKTLEDFEKSGGKIPEPLKNQKLTARETLMRVTTDANQAKMRALLERAYADAERAAATEVLRGKIAVEADPARKEELMSQLDALRQPDAVPDPLLVQQGFNLPKYAHWSRIKSLLGYEPSSLRVVQDLIKSDFKSAKFDQPGERAPDTRIDLRKLAAEPDKEVKRVFDEYQRGVERDLATATPEARQRVLDLIGEQVKSQLERLRADVRDKFLAERKAGAKITPEERATAEHQAVEKLVNAGLFKDPRLNLGDVIDQAAVKPAIKRLLPKLSDMIQQVLDTPISKQSDFAREFASKLSDGFDLSAEEKATAQRLFNVAFSARFKDAAERALKRAGASLAPKEVREFGPRTTLWRKITDFINAGGLDSGEFFEQQAVKHGWSRATPEQLAELRQLSDREEALRTPSARQLAEATTDEGRAKVARNVEDATLEERQQLKHRMQVLWSKLARPIDWRRHQILGMGLSGSNPEITRNNVAAMNELLSGNLLAKIGFPGRQVIDVATQGLVHLPTRAIDETFKRFSTIKDTSENALSIPQQAKTLYTELGAALREGLDGALAGVRPGLDNFKRTMAGRGEHRNVEQLVSAMSTFDRMRDRAKAYDAQGKPWLGFTTRLLTLIEYGRRFAAAADYLHGTPAEWQEIYHQIGRELRARKMSVPEMELTREQILGNITARRAEAEQYARQVLEERGINPTPAAVSHAAWNMVKGDVYADIQRAGLAPDDFRAHTDLLRNLVGWNLPEAGGPGGVVAKVFNYGKQVLERGGLPAPMFQFANAIGIGMNRLLAFTPIGLAHELFQGSPWYDEKFRTQRKVEAVLGTGVGAIVVGSILSGLMRYNSQMPRDPKEREAFIAAGHRVGNIEIHYPDGTYSSFSTSTGPFRYVAPYAAAAGALKDVMDAKAAQQAKMNADAKEKGVTPGTVNPLDSWDVSGALLHGAWATLSGGRTASGLVGSYVNPFDMSIKQPAAAATSALIPGLPGYQEVARALGASVDPRKADFIQMLVPIPGGSASRTNIMGDPLKNENDVQRVVSILTGGNYPIPVDDKPSEAAYKNYLTSDFRPQATNPDRGYLINGQWRPLTRQELQTYVTTRGAAFKDALAALGDLSALSPEDRTKAVRGAYQAANARGLQAAGVAPKGASSAASAGRAVTPSRASSARIGRSSRLGRGSSSLLRAGARLGVQHVKVGRLGRSHPSGRLRVRS